MTCQELGLILVLRLGDRYRIRENVSDQRADFLNAAPIHTSDCITSFNNNNNNNKSGHPTTTKLGATQISRVLLHACAGRIENRFKACQISLSPNQHLIHFLHDPGIFSLSPPSPEAEQGTQVVNKTKAEYLGARTRLVSFTSHTNYETDLVTTV